MLGTASGGGLPMSYVDVRTQWRGRRDTTSWRFRALLLLSGILHVFLTPWAGFWGLARWLPATDLEAFPEEPVNAIPIDFVADRPEPPRPAPADDEPAASPPPEKEQEEGPEDAPKPAEPEPAPPEPPQPSSEPEPSAPSADEAQAIGDPVALSGSAGKIADANANVRLLLYTDRIRGHALGARVGKLLQATPQWRDFFGPAQVDPIRDIDRVLIAGPQLRDSSNVVAVVRHSLPEDQIRAGLDALIARGDGEWVEGKVRMARARADRADRLFVLPAPGIVAVVPPSAEASARSMGSNVRFAAGPEGVAVQAYIVTPWRVFQGLPVQVPDSIEWVRLELRPRADGGVTLRLLGQDESPEAAARSAREIELLVRNAMKLLSSAEEVFASLRSLVTGKTVARQLEDVRVHAQDRKIVGTVELSKSQLVMIADLLEGLIVQAPSRPAPSEPAPPPSPPGLPSPPSRDAPPEPRPSQQTVPETTRDAAPSPVPPDAAPHPPAPDPPAEEPGDGPSAER